jgi:hypothetical protein
MILSERTCRLDQWPWSCLPLQPLSPPDMPEKSDGTGIPVVFKGVGSGVETPAALERAANEDITRRIGAPHSLHSAGVVAETD